MGMEAPNFDDLPGIDGKAHSLDDFNRYDALVIIFMCVHCPYVQKIEDQIVELLKEYATHEVKVIGINPNDVERYPDDSLENMKERAEEQGYGDMVYLRDDSQEVAREYQAECTPDIYVFDKNRELTYHGRIEEVPEAIERMQNDDDLLEDQIPSQGCSIKWNE